MLSIHETTAISCYLGDAGKLPLLTRQQEVELFKIIEKGRSSQLEIDEMFWEEFFQPDVADETPLRRQGRKQYLQGGVLAGQDAREKVVRHNLRLVVSIAEKHLGKCGNLDIMDLIEEGNFGLLRSIEGFQWRRGYKFATYATWWIRQFIGRAVANFARTVRIPQHIITQISKCRRMEIQLGEVLGRVPLLSDIAFMMNLSPEEVEEIKDISQTILSLDFITPNADGSLEQLLCDSNQAGSEEISERSSLQELFQEALKVFSDRDRQIIAMRFGLGGGGSYTLSQIGERFKLSRERIRQIERKVLHRLQRDKNISHFAPPR